MHVEVFDGYGPSDAGAAPVTLWHQFVARLREGGTTYELDPHLANDIGASTYTLPPFAAAKRGEWK